MFMNPQRRRTPRAMLLAIVGVTLLAAACSTAAAPAPGPTPAAAPSPSLTPVPSELWGTWQSTLPVNGVTQSVVFSAHSWATYGDDPAQGPVGRAWAAGPDQVVFGPRGACTTKGTYTWTIADSLLTLSGGADDVCAKQSLLTTHTWKKFSDSTSPADSDVTR